MEKIIKLGVVGLGRGADVAKHCIGFKNAKLCAACDINPETMENAKKKFEALGEYDCKYFSDYDEMLKSDIDAVIVATEAIYHVPIVKKALDAGKHVLSEIPAINSLEEAYELKEAVNAHPELIYMSGENCCYWAFIKTWKAMREKGEFGDIVYAEAEYLHAMNPDKFAPDNYPKDHWRTYNPAIKYITHELGPLLYVMNDRCKTITCFEPDVVYNPYFPNKVSNGVALIKTEKGAVIKILISFGAYTSFDHNYRVIGTRGLVETDRLTMVDNAHSFANLHSVPGTFEKKIEIPVTTAYPGEESEGHGGADRVMLKDFVDCVAEGRRPELDVDFAINMSLPGILGHESAVRGGEPMEIPII
jgi:predicted dehydrogenase